MALSELVGLELDLQGRAGFGQVYSFSRYFLSTSYVPVTVRFRRGVDTLAEKMKWRHWGRNVLDIFWPRKMNLVRARGSNKHIWSIRQLVNETFGQHLLEIWSRLKHPWAYLICVKCFWIGPNIKDLWVWTKCPASLVLLYTHDYFPNHLQTETWNALAHFALDFSWVTLRSI